MGLGGPVWHASAMALPGRYVSQDRVLVEAMRALEGVGDATLGEWVEQHRAVHVRRRLSSEEELRVGPVVDIRGSDEARRRRVLALADLPVSVREQVPDESVDEVGY